MGKYEDDHDGEKKNEVSYPVFMADGNVLFRQAEFGKAKYFYEKCLALIRDEEANKDADQNEEKKSKDEIEVLISLSKCYLELGDADKSLEYAEEALSKDDKQINALYHKAEAQYMKGEFETALVFYCRGNRSRPELQEFRLGIQKSKEAIENCVGTPESVKLTSTGDLTYFYQKEEEEKEKKKQQQQNQKGKGQGKAYGKQKKENKKKEKTIKRVSPSEQKTIKVLLGELYNDRNFLEQLLDEEKNIDQKTAASRTIQDLCIEGINYLDSRTDFWRQQKPMYARKRDKMLQRQQWKKGHKSDEAMKYILNAIEEIDEDQNDGEYERSLRKCKRTHKRVEFMTDDECANKDEVNGTIYSYMGNAYLELGKCDTAQQYHERDLEIAKKEKNEDARSRALDNLGRVYARTGRFKKAVSVWTEKEPLSKSDLERTWLYHEIGRCHLELEDFSKALEYGQKSLDAAEGADDDVWKLNATVLIAQSQVKKEDYDAAVDSFERALEMSQMQGDKPAEEAIKKALDDVKKKIVESEEPAEEKEGSDKGETQEEGEQKAIEEQQEQQENTERSEPEPEQQQTEQSQE